MASKRWELLDNILGLISIIASDAPSFPDYLLEIGLDMEKAFSRLEEDINELKLILKQDINALEEIAEKVQLSKSYYYTGQYELGKDVLWEIYNDQDRIMKLK